jgi:hypothetical protein
MIQIKRCAAVYYMNAKKVREKTPDKCQLEAEWSVEWRVVPVSGPGNASVRKGLEVCRHHIIQAYYDAQESGAIAGDIRLLGKDQRDNWDSQPAPLSE